jgi:membrane protein involved in colicin uptake
MRGGCKLSRPTTLARSSSICSQRPRRTPRYGRGSRFSLDCGALFAATEIFMSTLSLSSAFLVVAATGAGGGVAWLATALHFRTKLAELGAQFEQAERAKQKAQELALQSRAQVEALQQALSEAKRDGAIHNAASSAKAVTAAAAAAEATKAKANARADLLRQLDSQDNNDRSAHGFADTQPLGS